MQVAGEKPFADVCGWVDAGIRNDVPVDESLGIPVRIGVLDIVGDGGNVHQVGQFGLIERFADAGGQLALQEAGDWKPDIVSGSTGQKLRLHHLLLSNMS